MVSLGRFSALLAELEPRGTDPVAGEDLGGCLSRGLAPHEPMKRPFCAAVLVFSERDAHRAQCADMSVSASHCTRNRA